MGGSQEISVYGDLNFETGFGGTDHVVVNIVRTSEGWSNLDDGIGIDARAK